MKLYRRYARWFYRLHGVEYGTNGGFEDISAEDMGRCLGNFFMILVGIIFFCLITKGFAQAQPKYGVEVQATAVIHDSRMNYRYEYKYEGETYRSEPIYAPTRFFDNLIGNNTVLVDPILPNHIRVYWPARVINSVCNGMMLFFSLVYVLFFVRCIMRCHEISKQNRLTCTNI